MTTLLGKRIEIPVHYDLWARGARTGTVLRYHRGRSAYLTVKMDHPQVKRLLRLWEPDWPYVKVIAEELAP